jgi:DNA replication protein DnaC
MVFSEILKLYVDGHPLTSEIEFLLPLVCAHTGEDVLINAYNHRRDKVYYYHLYLDSLGEVTRQTPLVTFETYNDIYAKAFERKLRQKRVVNPKTNELLCKQFNVPERYYGVSFATLPHIKEQEQLINTAKRWTKSYKESLLLGSKTTGVGKTTCAVSSLMQYYVDHDSSPIRSFTQRWDVLNSNIIFLKERDLYGTIRRTYANDIPLYEHQITERLANVDFLVYDDMFSINDGDFLKRVLFSILDERIDGQGKPTIITSRYPLAQLQRNFPDIYSRLERGVIYYHSSTKDLRRLK